MIHRPAVLKAIKGKPREEQMEYLTQLGFDHQQAVDFIVDYEKNSIKVRKYMEPSVPFNESEAFKQITERLNRLKNKMYGRE